MSYFTTEVTFLFIEYLAEANGYVLDFDKVSKNDMIRASAEAFAYNYEYMNGLLKKIIEVPK